MSQAQIQNNNKKLPKVKKPKPKGHVACVLTLVLEIVATVSLFCIAIAPPAYILFALFVGLFAVVGVIITTIFTAGLAWTSEGFRNFWAGTFSWIGNIFEKGPEVIVYGLKDSIILISLLLLSAAISGFVVNLVFFVKHKQNKVKFILSCVFLVLAIVNVILALTIYLNWK